MTSATRSRRRQKQRPRRFWRFGVIAGLLITLLLFGYGCLLIYTSLLAPLSPRSVTKTIYVTVKPGMDEHAIGKVLAERGVIRHARGFQLAVLMDHIAPSSLHPGTYRLSPAMPPRQIAQIIALGRTAPIVVVPPGFTVDQIADRLDHLGIVDRQSFLDTARTRGRTFHVDGFTPPADNLEGYLCPGTYPMETGSTARDTIEPMLHTFRAMELSRGGGELARRPDLQKVITMASLIEKEAKVPSDRPLISAALNNRLDRGMKLQCDATVEYALPEHKDRLYDKDLTVVSPYNTYLHAGLPPTPIASPGWPSIEAAMHPAHVGYLYYVAGPGGKHIFSTTQAEHERAVHEVQALRDSASASSQ